MTNLEKIKQMTAEEMGEFIKSIASCGGYMCGDCEATFVCKPSECFGENLVEILNMEVKE